MDDESTNAGNALAATNGLRLIRLETGVVYYIAARGDTPEELNAIIIKEYGEGTEPCEPEDLEDWSISIMSQASVMEKKLQEEDGSLTPLWTAFIMATEPCIISCSEY